MEVAIIKYFNVALVKVMANAMDQALNVLSVSLSNNQIDKNKDKYFFEMNRFPLLRDFFSAYL